MLLMNKSNTNISNSSYDWEIDISFWVLFVSNIINIFLILSSRANFFTVFLVYLVQAFIICIFYLIRILKINSFSVVLSKIEKFKKKEEIKNQAIKQFLFIYGLFFFLAFAVSFLFLKYSLRHEEINYQLILNTSLVFLGNHFFSFCYNYKHLTRGGDINKIAFEPLLRIFPIYFVMLFIVFGFYTNLLLSFFLIIRGGFDLVGHIARSMNYEGITPSSNYFIRKYGSNEK